MDALVYLPLVVPFLAGAAARPLAERLPPRTATWLLAASAVVLAGASWAVLGLLALAAAFQVPRIDLAGDIPQHAMSRTDPAPVPLGVLAGALLAAAATAAVRAAWRRTAALIAAHRQGRSLPGAGQMLGAAEVIVVTDDAVDAYAVPGWPSRIVVTSGMLDALTQAERDVLVAHERAHASSCHYLFTAAARLAAAANPLLRPLAGAVGYAVERWADEQAAAAAGSRSLTARTIAKAALAATAQPLRRAGSTAVLGILPGPSLSRDAGVVPRRVAALLAPPPQRRLLLLIVAVALVAASGLSALDAARDLHRIIEFAQAAAGS
jgi:Zn-dependent protease with chaperone function